MAKRGGMFWIPADVINAVDSIKKKENLKRSEALRKIVTGNLEVKTTSLYELITNEKKR